MITQEDMNGLAAHGRKGVLQKVEPFHYIETEEGTVPFVGSGCAIRRILCDGVVAYRNPAVPPDYDVRSVEAVDAVRKQSFGIEVAAKFRVDRLGRESKGEEK